MSRATLDEEQIQDPRWADWTEVDKAGSHPTSVLLLGGLSTSAYIWWRVGAALDAMDRTWNASSLFGHTGFACHLPASSAGKWIDEAEARLLRLYEQTRSPMVLGGFSAGSLVSSVLAARHPEKVLALALVGFCPRLRSRAKQSFVTSVGLAERWVPGARRQLQRHWIASGSKRISPLETDEYRSQPRMHQVPLTAIAALGQLQSRATSALKRTSHPIFLYHGGHDERMSAESAARWADWLTRRGHETKLRIFERSPHSVLLCGEADECAASIVEDIRGLS